MPAGKPLFLSLSTLSQTHILTVLLQEPERCVAFLNTVGALTPSQTTEAALGDFFGSVSFFDAHSFPSWALRSLASALPVPETTAAPHLAQALRERYGGPEKEEADNEQDTWGDDVDEDILPPAMEVEEHLPAVTLERVRGRQALLLADDGGSSSSSSSVAVVVDEEEGLRPRVKARVESEVPPDAMGHPPVMGPQEGALMASLRARLENGADVKEIAALVRQVLREGRDVTPLELWRQEEALLGACCAAVAGDEVPSTSLRSFLSDTVRPHLSALTRPASRALMEGLANLAKGRPRPVLDCVLLPLLTRPAEDLGSAPCEACTRLVKQGAIGKVRY